MRRAVNNLLDNAARATTQRHGRGAWCVEDDRGYVAVEVLDDGHGLRDDPGRTGWGLAQVRATIDAHGGLLERPDVADGRHADPALVAGATES